MKERKTGGWASCAVEKYGRQGVVAAILAAVVAIAVVAAAVFTLTAGYRDPGGPDNPQAGNASDSTPVTDGAASDSPVEVPGDTDISGATGTPPAETPAPQPSEDTTSRADMEVIEREQGSINIGFVTGETVYV